MSGEAQWTFLRVQHDKFYIFGKSTTVFTAHPHPAYDEIKKLGDEFEEKNVPPFVVRWNDRRARKMALDVVIRYAKRSLDEEK